MRSTRIKWVIALAVVVSGIWFMGVFYVLTYKPDVYIAPDEDAPPPLPPPPIE